MENWLCSLVISLVECGILIVNTRYINLGEKTWTGKGLKDYDQGTTQLPKSQPATVGWGSPASGERQTDSGLSFTSLLGSGLRVGSLGPHFLNLCSTLSAYSVTLGNPLVFLISEWRL